MEPLIKKYCKNKQTLRGLPIRVVISGGGPVGLLLAIMLNETLGNKVEVAIYDKRWKKNGNKVYWKTKKDGNTRRTQVITLQSKLLKLLPSHLLEHLLPNNGFSEVWPYSQDSPIELGRPKNIRIIDIENRLLNYVQNSNVQLIPEKFQPEKVQSLNCDILAICEGVHSQTRQYYKSEFGLADPFPYSINGEHLEDVILSIQVKSGLSTSEAVLLTLIQRRFLLNMTNDGYGHLNVRLTKGEAQEFKRSNSIFSTTFWPKIQDGLKLFSIQPDDVMEINCFNISMKHESRFSTIINYESSSNATHTFLLGDAANGIHFWPGRGLNQGFVSVMSLVKSLQERLLKGNVLRAADYSKHEAVMHMLQHRHKSRAWEAMIRRVGNKSFSISQLIDVDDELLETNRNQLLNELFSQFVAISSRLNSRLPNMPNWDMIKERLELISNETLKALVVSGPWETFWSGGPEIDLNIFYPKAN